MNVICECVLARDLPLGLKQTQTKRVGTRLASASEHVTLYFKTGSESST